MNISLVVDNASCSGHGIIKVDSSQLAKTPTVATKSPVVTND